VLYWLLGKECTGTGLAGRDTDHTEGGGMIRNVLLVLEIVIAVAAILASPYMIFRNLPVLSGKTPVTGPKLRVIVDMAVFDVITIVMIISAYLIYSSNPWGRWVSLVAGLVLIAGASVRTDLAGLRTWLAPILGVLGIVVVVLAILLPSTG
jgi:hypothetical protein